MLDTQVVEDAGDHEVHQIFDAFGFMVEPWRRRHDGHAKTGKLEHVLQMDRREGALPGNQNQLAPLLDHHVRRPLQQVVRGAVGNGRDGAHGAGADHHLFGGRRAGSHRREPLLLAAGDDLTLFGTIMATEVRRQLPGGARPILLLLGLEHNPGRRGGEQEDPIVRLHQAFQQAQGIGSAGGAGQRQSDGLVHDVLCCSLRRAISLS